MSQPAKQFVKPKALLQDQAYYAGQQEVARTSGQHYQRNDETTPACAYHPQAPALFRCEGEECPAPLLCQQCVERVYRDVMGVRRYGRRATYSERWECRHCADQSGCCCTLL
eukprot:TRINITY_DN9350_c0_g1_i1.p2 TRINITY_DN9350_c0_g1~~TRINITY_DN9350_c0_g1_i1.p2  ORF type:complete len:112 (+),score=8.64 TRINITY_DN9350_c0_g1_i1:44-379(+)